MPGIDETLRVGGKGKLSADPELLASMVEFGKPPRAVLRIDVKEAYFHCGKALMRSKLWSARDRVERAVMPSIGEVIHDQTGLGEPESQDVIYERYKTQLVAAAIPMPESGPVSPTCPGTTLLATGYWSPAMTSGSSCCGSASAQSRSRARRHASGCRAQARCA